jgi:hypothetical protein
MVKIVSSDFRIRQHLGFFRTFPPHNHHGPMLDGFYFKQTWSLLQLNSDFTSTKLGVM